MIQTLWEHSGISTATTITITTTVTVVVMVVVIAANTLVHSLCKHLTDVSLVGRLSSCEVKSYDYSYSHFTQEEIAIQRR